MKRGWTGLIIGLILIIFAGYAQASIAVIGKATYQGADYNLIYDDDDTGYGGGGLVWLDYTKSSVTWIDARFSWVNTLGSQLVVTLNPGVSTDIDWTMGWRLPDAGVDIKAKNIYGYIGDPNSDGIYTYTSGYNLANSELGHLFYVELGNLGAKNTSGDSITGYGLKNTEYFENLIEDYYWSAMERFYWDNTKAWAVNLGFGSQAIWPFLGTESAIAVISGNVDISTVPVPGAIWLLGSGLIGLVGLGKKDVIFYLTRVFRKI